MQGAQLNHGFLGWARIQVLHRFASHERVPRFRARVSPAQTLHIRVLLALHSSMKEVRHSVANRALVIDVCVGIDLLIENAGRRFGFPLLLPGYQVIPAAPRQHLVDELTLETPPSEPTSSPRPETSLNAPSTRHEQQTV